MPKTRVATPLKITSLSERLASYDQVDGVTVLESVNQGDLIGIYRGGSGFTSLTINRFGGYEYEDCGLGCMYSYRGYSGPFEIEGNVITLRQAKPTPTYQAIYPAANSSPAGPFIQFDVLRFKGELVLVESSEKDDFLRNGVSGRACFRRSPRSSTSEPLR